MLLLFPFYRWENRGLERENNLHTHTHNHKVSKGQSWDLNQVCLTQRLRLLGHFAINNCLSHLMGKVVTSIIPGIGARHSPSSPHRPGWDPYRDSPLPVHPHVLRCQYLLPAQSRAKALVLLDAQVPEPVRGPGGHQPCCTLYSANPQLSGE